MSGREEASAVRLESVAVRLGGRMIFQDLTAEIPAGEFVAIMGPNGAGKSTLLRALLGLQPIAAGRIAIDGHAPGRGAARVGYVPQWRHLDADAPVTVRDLVALGIDGDRWGIRVRGRAEVRRRVDTVLAQVGAGAYASAPAGRLSGGEQQRALLAQALVNGPRLLLLDEPLSNLDLQGQREVVDLVAGIARRLGVTVLMVVHDVNPLLPVLDRVLYLAGGSGVMGSVDEVIRSDVLTRLYRSPVEVFHADGRIFVAAMR